MVTKEMWQNDSYRESMSKQSKLLWDNEKYKEKVLSYLQSDKNKLIVSNRFKNIPKTEEAKQKMSINRKNKKPILIDNILYNSISEASKLLLIDKSTIRNRLRHESFPNYVFIKNSPDNIPSHTRSEYMKEYRKKNKPKRNTLKEKEYREKRKNKIKEYQKSYMRERRSNDINFRLRDRIRGLINRAIVRRGYTKKSKTEEILGCSFIEFRNHIESQFEKWMTWDNYGKYNGELNHGWDIDHIIPVSKGKSEIEIIKLNHYTNLRPLCSKYNRDIKKNN